MNKKVLLRKIIRKFFKTKEQINKEKYLQILKKYEFLAKIVNPKDFIIQDLKKDKLLFFKKFDYKKLYKEKKLIYNEIISKIKIENLLPCNDKTLREYQLSAVEHAKNITDFFEENNLKYFITSGTLLGAIRHKGFIPWDDDIDIGMMRDDYEKLKKILASEYDMVKINKVKLSKDNKNKLISSALKKTKKGFVYYISHRYIQIIKGKTIKDAVFLDIFPHDYYSDNLTISELKEMINEMKILDDREDFISNKVVEVEKKLKNNKKIVAKSNKIYFALDSLDSYLFTPTKFMTEDIIFPRKKIKFENKEFYAPNKTEEYLKFQYPNFMKMPSDFEIAPDFYERLNKSF